MLTLLKIGALMEFDGNLSTVQSYSFTGLRMPEMVLHKHLPIPLYNSQGWSEVKWSEVAQSCPTLCDPMDCSLSGSSVHGIFQARVLEWIAVSFSRGSSQPRNRSRVSHIAGRYFTIWANREAQPRLKPQLNSKMWPNTELEAKEKMLLSHFSHVRLCGTPQMAAHQDAPSMGFSRQEHWSGLPFPSPMHESESEVVSDPQQPRGLQPSRLLPPWDFPGKSTGVGCHRLLRKRK